MNPTDLPDLRALTQRFSSAGRVEAIFLRPKRDAPALEVQSAVALVDRGLEGDRSAQRAQVPPGGSKRQVTLLQSEHLPLIARWAGREAISAALLRRNLVIAGVNLVALRSPFADQPLWVRIGPDVVLSVTGPCDPCSKMEAALGTGGYNVLRGHGGMTARILASGVIEVGHDVRVELGRPAP